MLRPGVGRREHARTLELRLRRLDEIGGSAHHRRRERLDRLHHLLAGVAGGHLLPGRELRQRLDPAGARLAGPVRLPLLAELRERLGPELEAVVPLLLGLDPGGPHVHVLVDGVGDVEVLVRVEPERLLRGPHLVLAERRAVRLRRVDRVRRAVGDVAAHDHERRPLLLGLRRADRALERGDVLGVLDRLHVPALRLEALGLVLGGEGERGRAVDRDVVVVVEVDEPAEAEVAGERRGLVADALHQVAVRADRVDAAVDDVVVGPVVALGQEAVGDREADAVREALPERTGRGLDALGHEVLRMARRSRFPLPEALQLLEREVVAGQVQRGVLEDAGVAGGEDEPVAVRPVRVRRVVAHHVSVEHVRERRECHRRARVTRVRLLDRVHRERPDRVDRELPDLCVFAHSLNDMPRPAASAPSTGTTLGAWRS